MICLFNTVGISTEVLLTSITAHQGIQGATNKELTVIDTHDELRQDSIQTLAHELDHVRGDKNETLADLAGLAAKLNTDAAIIANQDTINPIKAQLGDGTDTLTTAQNQALLNQNNQTFIENHEGKEGEWEYAIIVTTGKYGETSYIQLEGLSSDRFKSLSNDDIIYLDNNVHNTSPDNKITVGEYRNRLQAKYYDSIFDEIYSLFLKGNFSEGFMKYTYGERFTQYHQNQQYEKALEEFKNIKQNQGIISDDPLTWPDATQNTMLNMSKEVIGFAIEAGKNPVDTVKEMLNVNNYIPTSDDIENISAQIEAIKNGDKQATTDAAATIFLTILTKKKGSNKDSTPTPATITDQNNDRIEVSTINGGSGWISSANTDKEPTPTKATCATGTVCFTAGTLIETSEGLKAIETFTGGELIWSRNDTTLEYGYYPVIATKATPDQPIFQVTVKNNQGDIETLETTAEHPFWIKDTGWLKASLLEQGMILLDRNNQEVEVLSQYLIPNHTDTVYNIEVDNFHTYHVGRLGVWVHNADCCGVRVVSGNIVNKAGDFYPNIPDPRTGRPIPFPNETLQIVPKESRVIWDNQERYNFIKAWHDKGYPEPRGGWAEYDIHHIKPREYGGTNDFWNLVPVQRKTHQQEFNNFWRGVK